MGVADAVSPGGSRAGGVGAAAAAAAVASAPEGGEPLKDGPTEACIMGLPEIWGEPELSELFYQRRITHNGLKKKVGWKFGFAAFGDLEQRRMAQAALLSESVEGRALELRDARMKRDGAAKREDAQVWARLGGEGGGAGWGRGGGRKKGSSDF